LPRLFGFGYNRRHEQKPIDRRPCRTVERSIKASAQPALWAILHGGQEILNAGTYLIRQIALGFEKGEAKGQSRRKPDASIKPEHKAAMEAAIALFNGCLGEVEDLREKNHPKKLAKARAEAKAKGGTFDEASWKPFVRRAPIGETADKLWGYLLDEALLTRVLKRHADPAAKKRALAVKRKGQAPAAPGVFESIPYNYAKACVKRVIANFSLWLESAKAWTPESGAGFPSMPGYLPRGVGCSIDFAWSSAGFGNLPGLEKFTPSLFADEGKALALAAVDLAAYADFDIKKEVQFALDRRWEKKPELWGRKPTWEDVTTVRFLPRGQEIRMQIVARLNLLAPEGSFLAELERREPELWKKTTEARTADAFDAWMARILRPMDWRKGKKIRELPDNRANPFDWIVAEGWLAAGVDMGVNNAATIAWSDGSHSDVHSANEFHRSVAKIERAIGRRQAALTTPEQKALQQKREELAESDPPRKLERKDAKRLKELGAAVWKDAKLLALAARKRRVVQDFVERLTAEIAQKAANKRAAFVVVGQNLLWKTGSAMGAEENRRFHRIPHARAIERLRAKLRALGIALVVVEESFTSQASFAHGDAMPSIQPPKTRKSKPQAEEAPAALTAEQERALAQAQAELASRHRFVRAERRERAAAEEALREASRASKAALAKARKAQKTAAGQKKAADAQASETARAARGEARPARQAAKCADPAEACAASEQKKSNQSTAKPSPSGEGASAAQGQSPFKASGARGDASRRKILENPKALSRDWFVFAAPVPGLRLTRVHADANGASNILRKACPKHAWRPGMSTKHDLWLFEPRRGFFRAKPLVPARQAAPGESRAPL
jgi:IS605 OrfB family transposase